MAFRVKLDEDLPEGLLEVLAGQGYDVASVRTQGWKGLEDEVLWPRVTAEARFFVTADKEFGDVRKFPPGTHSGILLLRAGRESFLVYRALLFHVMASYRLEALAGCLVVASFGDIRVRRVISSEPQAGLWV